MAEICYWKILLQWPRAIWRVKVRTNSHCVKPGSCQRKAVLLSVSPLKSDNFCHCRYWLKCCLALRGNTYNLKCFLLTRGFQREAGKCRLDTALPIKIEQIKFWGQNEMLRPLLSLGCSLSLSVHGAKKDLAFLLYVKFHQASWKSVKKYTIKCCYFNAINKMLFSRACVTWRNSMLCWILILQVLHRLKFLGIYESKDCIFSEMPPRIFFVTHVGHLGSNFIYN